MNTTALRTTLIATGLTLLGLSAAHAQVTYGYGARSIYEAENGTETLFGDIAEPSTGGTFTNSITSYTDQFGLAATGSGNSSTSAGGGVANSTSTLNNWHFTYNGHTASADSVTVTSHADLNTISGEATYTNLFVTGSGLYDGTYDGTVPINTFFDFGNGVSIELNEQQPGLGVVSGTTISNYEITYGFQANGGVFAIEGAVAGANVTLDTAATPEPGSIALFVGMGLSGSIFLKRCRRKVNQSVPVTGTVGN